MTYKFYDFFAGGGMAGIGLGPGWSCIFANDIDACKGKVYRQNHSGGQELLVRSVEYVTTADLPSQADLVWASFPCQDLSLAGYGAGLHGNRSGTFWPFWGLIRKLGDEGRLPRIVVLENVYGALTSHCGRDFAEIVDAISILGLRVGALVIDAVHFVPQSRPRLFIVGVRSDLDLPAELVNGGPTALWHPSALTDALMHLPKAAESKWVWWDLPAPPPRNINLSSLIEDTPHGVRWHSTAETRHILGLMTEQNLQKVEAAKRMGRPVVGTVYRRTRPDGAGGRRQRAEVRFDEIAGCLRTPAGGSSRQTILIVDGLHIRSRLLSPREAARLMGLPDDYLLPTRYNDAYHLVGDGVVVPVVRHLTENLLQTILEANQVPAAA